MWSFLNIEAAWSLHEGCQSLGCMPLVFSARQTLLGLAIVTISVRNILRQNCLSWVWCWRGPVWWTRNQVFAFCSSWLHVHVQSVLFVSKGRSTLKWRLSILGLPSEVLNIKALNFKNFLDILKRKALSPHPRKGICISKQFGIHDWFGPVYLCYEDDHLNIRSKAVIKWPDQHWYMVSNF